MALGAIASGLLTALPYIAQGVSAVAPLIGQIQSGSANGSSSAAMAVNIITDLLLMLSLLRPRGGAAAHFLKLSLSATARLKMGRSGVESLSRQK